MSLVTPDKAVSYDQSGVYKLDLSEVLSAILLDDTDFLSVIGISGDVALQTKHSWIEDALNAVAIVQSGGSGTQLALGNTSGTAIAISASHAARVTAGTLLRDRASGKTETVQVTTAVAGSAGVTVARGYGSTSAQTHAAGATWDIIANPRPQGMDGPKDESTTRALKYNYTQIFSKGVNITGTAESIQHAGITSEQDYQIDMRLRELKRELDRTCIMGSRSSADVVDGTYGTMGGIIEFVGNIEASNINGTAETLTPTVLNAMIKQVYDDGGSPDLVLVGGVQKQKISSFDQEYRQSTMDTTRAGFVIDQFKSDLGFNLRVVVDRWVPSDVCLVLDSSRIKIMPLSGRAFFMEPLAKTGDRQKWQVVGEYTMEVRNASEAHAYHFNLKQ